MLVVFKHNWLAEDNWPRRHAGLIAAEGAALVSLNTRVRRHSNGAIKGEALSALPFSAVRKPLAGVSTGRAVLTSGTTVRRLGIAAATGEAVASPLVTSIRRVLGPTAVLGGALDVSVVAIILTPQVHRIVYGGFGAFGVGETLFDPKMIWAGGAKVIGRAVPSVISRVLNISYAKVTGRGSLFGRANRIRSAKVNAVGKGLVKPLISTVRLTSSANVMGDSHTMLRGRRTLSVAPSITGIGTIVKADSYVNNSAASSVTISATAGLSATINAEPIGSAVGKGRARLTKSRIITTMNATTLTGTSTVVMSPNIRRPATLPLRGRGTGYGRGYTLRGGRASLVGNSLGKMDTGVVYAIKPTKATAQVTSYMRGSTKKSAEANLVGASSAVLIAGRKKHSNAAIWGDGNSIFNSLVYNRAKAVIGPVVALRMNTSIVLKGKGAAQGRGRGDLKTSVRRPAWANFNAETDAELTPLLRKIISEVLSVTGNSELNTVVKNVAVLNIVPTVTAVAAPAVIWSVGAVAKGVSDATLRARRFRKNLLRYKPISVTRTGRKFKRD